MPKYQLETIPVWEAYEAKAECPLCYLEPRAEKHYLEFFLGASVMAPEIRAQVNETGYCPRHFELLFQGENKLGLALQTHTHLRELMNQLGRHQEQILHNVRSKVRGKKKGVDRSVDELRGFLESHQIRCMICSRLQATLERYAFTILYLWKKDGEFRDVFAGSAGFCLHHFPLMLNMMSEALPKAAREEWLAASLPLQESSLARLERDLKDFTRSYDYQSGKEKKSSTDSLPLAIQKITGKKPSRS